MSQGDLTSDSRRNQTSLMTEVMIKAKSAPTLQGASNVSGRMLGALDPCPCPTLAAAHKAGTVADSDFQMRKAELREVGTYTQGCPADRAEPGCGPGPRLRARVPDHRTHSLARGRLAHQAAQH